MEVTDDGLIISPVPAKDVLYIQWKSASPNDNYTIEFISMNGASYRMSPYTAAQLKGGIALDIKAFTEGHYLIRISGTKSTVSSKLIIR